MHRLLYYPNFEIQDPNFLKFALLYIDEIRPIIPVVARRSLSDSMKNILNNTELICPYTPSYEDGYLASIAAVHYLEKQKLFVPYTEGWKRNKYARHNYTLYAEKYTYEFEKYCVENGLGERCDEGICIDEDVAYAYMSILAEIISKETEIDMITDNAKYSDPSLRNFHAVNRRMMDRLGTIRREIQFYVPVDMERIPLHEFIELRSDPKFERVRKNFVIELNHVLDSYDKSMEEVDLKKLMECKQEMYSFIKELFISCAAVAVGVHSFGNMYATDRGTLDFWGNVGNLGISLDTLKQHCGLVREYAASIHRKKQARKYLAKLRQLRAEVL